MAKRRNRRSSAAAKQKKQLQQAGIGVIALGVLLIVIALLVCGLRSCGEDTPQERTTTTSATAATSTTATTKATATAPTAAPTAPTEPTASTAPTEPTVPNTEAYPADGSWNLLLVNGSHPLAEETVNDTSDLWWHSGSESVDYRVYDALNDMLEAGAEYGLWVCSGYRSYETQSILYNNEVAEWESYGYSHEEALDMAATVVARPGTSEHHTGLAVDLLSNECWDLVEEWEDTQAFEWMMANCYQYGFILRYPKDKQDITGVIYEPWHYRYVGVEAATYMMQNGLTLEEYLGQV